MAIHSAGCLTGVGLIIGIALLFIAPPIGILVFIIAFIIDMATTGMKDFGEGVQKINEARQTIKESKGPYYKYICPYCQHEDITNKPLGFLCDNCNNLLHIQSVSE